MRGLRNHAETPHAGARRICSPLTYSGIATKRLQVGRTLTRSFAMTRLDLFTLFPAEVVCLAVYVSFRPVSGSEPDLRTSLGHCVCITVHRHDARA